MWGGGEPLLSIEHTSLQTAPCLPPQSNLSLAKRSLPKVATHNTQHRHRGHS